MWAKLDRPLGRDVFSNGARIFYVAIDGPGRAAFRWVSREKPGMASWNDRSMRRRSVLRKRRAHFVTNERTSGANYEACGIKRKALQHFALKE